MEKSIFTGLLFEDSLGIGMRNRYYVIGDYNNHLYAFKYRYMAYTNILTGKLEEVCNKYCGLTIMDSHAINSMRIISDNCKDTVCYTYEEHADELPAMHKLIIEHMLKEWLNPVARNIPFELKGAIFSDLENGKKWRVLGESRERLYVAKREVGSDTERVECIRFTPGLLNYFQHYTERRNPFNELDEKSLGPITEDSVKFLLEFCTVDNIDRYSHDELEGTVLVGLNESFVYGPDNCWVRVSGIGYDKYLKCTDGTLSILSDVVYGDNIAELETIEHLNTKAYVRCKRKTEKPAKSVERLDTACKTKREVVDTVSSVLGSWLS